MHEAASQITAQCCTNSLPLQHSLIICPCRFVSAPSLFLSSPSNFYPFLSLSISLYNPPSICIFSSLLFTPYYSYFILTLHFSQFSFLLTFLQSILVEPQFSSVFLNLLLGRTNQLDDLQHLDAPMHRSLMAMKHAAARGEDISSWGIGFEVRKEKNIMGSAVQYSTLCVCVCVCVAS